MTRSQHRIRRLFIGTFAAGAAILTLLACPNRAPANPQMLVQMAACVKNIQEADYDKAETRCELCLEYDDNVPECLNAMGLIWYARGNEDKAREWYKKAIRRNNDFAEARNNMGVLEFVAGRFESAADFFAAAVEIDPRYLDARYNLALSHLRMGQRAFATIKDEDKRRKVATKHFADAEEQYRRIFELFPGHTSSYHDMGVIMTLRAEMEPIENKRREFIGDAETYFTRCLDLEPEHETCHGNLAHLFLGVARYDEALFHYVQCLAANSKNPICGAEIKLAYQGSQLQSEALGKYLNQIAENPGYGLGHYGFCIALFDKGLVEMAVTECENALKLDDTLCLAHYQLAKHYKTVFDKELAIENCRAMIECASDGKYASETQECREIVQALEVQE